MQDERTEEMESEWFLILCGDWEIGASEPNRT
jgi:hypothetical protein